MVLPEDIFSNITKLESIYLTDNDLLAVPNDALELQSLQEIYLFTSGNITEIHTIGFPKSNLKVFMLGVMLTSDIRKDTFQYFSCLPLQKLIFLVSNLAGNTYVVEKETFAPFSNVTEIMITNEVLPALGSLNSPLQELSISSFANSLTATKKTTLQVLQKFNSTLSYLAIQDHALLKRIENNSFIWTPFLITLYLDNNQINYVAKYAFSRLITLQKLNLASNDLKAVPTDAFEVFRSFSTLKYIDLNFNSISSNIANDAFSAVTASLTTLKLSMRGIYQENSMPWVNTFQLNHLLLKSFGKYNLKDIPVLDIPHNSLLSLQKIDIIDFEVYFYPCFAFPNLKSLKMDKTFIINFPTDLALYKCSNLRVLSLSNFERDVNSFDAKHWNISFPFLHTLKITQNKVTSIKPILEIKAPKLVTLDISNNLITMIDIKIAEVFPNLIYLNIADNDIVSLSGFENLKFLQYFNASGNQIQKIPSGLLSPKTDISLKILDLSTNPFICSCDIEPFKYWIISDNTTWLQPGQYVCASPEALEGMSITAIDLDCRSHSAFYLAVSIPSALVFCIGIIILIHYQWHIKYKLFLLYRRYHPFPNNEAEDFEMLQLQYHAYVSYNEESRVDDDWVMSNLQPNMEEGPEPQRLFIKSRDFMPGQSLIEGISENIQQSRKTILVLSPHFVESRWCCHEMEMAQMRLLDGNLDVLVLVLLNEIPNNKMTLSLRKLLCKKKYLKWPKDRAGQRLFWQRLRQELKSPVQVDPRFH